MRFELFSQTQQSVLNYLDLWLIKIKQNNTCQLEDLMTQAILTADAAQEGWSSILQIWQTEMKETGRWQKNQHLKNSNQRETQAVLMTPSMHNQLIEQNQIHSLIFYSDNQTAQYNLRRCSAAPNQIHLVILICKLLEEMNIQLITIHIPDLQNNKADALSRLAWRCDYMIKPEILQQTIEYLQFFPQLDSFATRTMRQYMRFYSIQKDRRAEKKRGRLQHQLDK
ncbi:MAG: hypothetical protein EZS28_052867 [Streblomastix strix]|uniref:RNase H type-1 domain-containing protein n=1 Tax=Streblomastix strix TaxID=222440 RepID=A0A5J4RSK6_9EUKA|nr:MAG: hypothetical protein EZS28_052867 [Streblomastix strix]